MLEEIISLDEVQAIIQIARQMAEAYQQSSTGENTELEADLISLVCCFQKLRDGYAGHNALSENYDKLHDQLSQIDPKDFYC